MALGWWEKTIGSMLPTPTSLMNFGLLTNLINEELWCFSYDSSTGGPFDTPFV